jgi:hypothetical protein
MHEVQGGCCAICQRSISLAKAVEDHDHGHRGKAHRCAECIRGVLCYRCNTGLGQFRDSPELLEAAARYLTRS